MKRLSLDFVVLRFAFLFCCFRSVAFASFFCVVSVDGNLVVGFRRAEIDGDVDRAEHADDGEADKARHDAHWARARVSAAIGVGAPALRTGGDQNREDAGENEVLEPLQQIDETRRLAGDALFRARRTANEQRRIKRADRRNDNEYLVKVCVDDGPKRKTRTD